MILHDVEVDGAPGLDVRLEGPRIVEIGPGGGDDARDEEVVDGGGGALLAGLHDHHLHLRAMAAAGRSVACGPPNVTRPEDLDDALRRAAAATPPGAWIRGAGYDERVAGPLDRGRLDELVPDRPLRVQERSGHLWILNTPALERIGGEDDAADGLRYDQDDRFRALDPVDPTAERAGVAEVSRRLARLGITGLTDATATNDGVASTWFDDARRDGVVLQHVRLLGGDGVTGPRKLLLVEHDLPDLDQLIADISRSHDERRPVAIHAASRATVVLALAAIDAAGSFPGDRLEHASVAPPELVAWTGRLGLTVVTQPGFVAAHGDRYLAEVDPDDQPWLYRGRGFRDAGVALAAGSDAPFGPEDPWLAMRAAVDRRATSGALVGADEGLSPESALGLYTGPPDQPGGPPRRVRVGAPADLCLLSVPWVEARSSLTSDCVAATVIDGAVVHHR